MILKKGAPPYRVRWREPNGDLRQQTCRTLEEARLVEAKKLATLAASPPAERPNVRLKEYSEQWLREIDVAPKTKSSYTESLVNYILPVLGKLRVRQLHRGHIKRLLGDARKRDGTPLSKNSLRLIRAALSVMLGDAVEDGIIPSNPVLGLARKGRKRRVGTVSQIDRQRSIRPMTYEQLAGFLQAAQQYCSRRDAVLYLTLADAGLRPGEALGLQWQDIDTIGRTIQVERAVSDGQIGPTKTEESRVVDLSTRLAEALAGWQAVLEAEALTSNRRPPEFVFASRTGKPLEAPTVARQFQALLRRVGIPRFRLYDLRHSFATHLLAEGAPITYVSDQLGHSKPTTTLAFYAHWLPRGDKAYIDRLTIARQAAGDLLVTKRTFPEPQASAKGS